MYRKHVGRALILALMLSGATSMNAQRITRQFKNVPLKTVLAEVEKELQYSIIYKKDEVNERKQITRDFKDASLEEVLSAVLDNGLSYSVQGKKIVISKKEAAGSSITQQKQIIVKGIVKDENGEPVCLVLILVDCVLKKSCYRLSINVKKTDNPFLILK